LHSFSGNAEQACTGLRSRCGALYIIQHCLCLYSHSEAAKMVIHDAPTPNRKLWSATGGCASCRPTPARRRTARSLPGRCSGCCAMLRVLCCAALRCCTVCNHDLFAHPQFKSRPQNQNKPTPAAKQNQPIHHSRMDPARSPALRRC